MKICVIAPSVIPILGLDQKYGGIESVMSVVVDELVGRGHDVYLYASAGSRSRAKIVTTTQHAIGQGVSYKGEVNANQRAYRLALANKPDVIWDNTLAAHAHKLKKNESKYLFKADISIDKKSLIDTGNIAVVQTIHGPAKDHNISLVRGLSKNGHFFVSISKDQARRYLKYITKSQHLGTVYNAIDLNYYKANYNKRTSNFLLWVGRFCMEKGPHIALMAAHELKMPLKLVGKKFESHEIAYFNKFVEPLLTPQDKVLENITNRQKAEFMRKANALMMTNLWPEPFGLVVAESMASGTPVVGPELGSLSELIDTAGVLIPLNNLSLNENDTEITQSQLDYVDRIVEHTKLAKLIPPQVPRKRAEFLFSAKHCVDGYEEAFEKAIFLKKKVSQNT